MPHFPESYLQKPYRVLPVRIREKSFTACIVTRISGGGEFAGRAKEGEGEK